MRTLKFYGSSDDLIEVESTCRDDGEPDEIGGDNALLRVYNRISEEALHVVVMYGPYGLWIIGIMQDKEDEDLPPWPMKWSNSGYSVVLEMEVPDEVRVKHIHEA